MNERLYRSTRDRVLAGVCGGIAERFDLDPSLVRVGVVVVGIVTAFIPILIIYIVMAVVVPEAPPDSTAQASSTPGAAPGPATVPRRPRQHDRTGAFVLGGLLIVVGIALAIRQYVEVDWSQVWPLIAIGFGVVLVVISILPGGSDRGRS